MGQGSGMDIPPPQPNDSVFAFVPRPVNWQMLKLAAAWWRESIAGNEKCRTRLDPDFPKADRKKGNNYERRDSSTSSWQTCPGYIDKYHDEM